VEEQVTAVKPAKDHPWNEDIQGDVDRARLRARIAGIRKRIDDLKSELKTLEGRLEIDLRTRSKARS
jgi:hypothetical protein